MSQNRLLARGSKFMASAMVAKEGDLAQLVAPALGCSAESVEEVAFT